MRKTIGGLLLRGLRDDMSKDTRSESQQCHLLPSWHTETAAHVIFLLMLYTREIFSNVSTTSKRFLSSSDNTAFPGLSTTKDFMPAAMAASTSLTLSLRNRIVSGAS